MAEDIILGRGIKRKALADLRLTWNSLSSRGCPCALIRHLQGTGIVGVHNHVHYTTMSSSQGAKDGSQAFTRLGKCSTN